MLALERRTERREKQSPVLYECSLVECIREFVRTNPNQKYCSDKCRNRATTLRDTAERERLVAELELRARRKCMAEDCANEFRPTTTRQNYCSAFCRDRVNKQKAKIERDEAWERLAIHWPPRKCAAENCTNMFVPRKGGTLQIYCSPRCRGFGRVFSNNRGFRHYGLTSKEADMLKEGAVCAICGTTEDLCVDHDHKTGRVRGVLCRWHNSGLGHFKDNPDNLRKAAEYLEHPDPKLAERLAWVLREAAADTHESYVDSCARARDGRFKG